MKTLYKIISSVALIIIFSGLTSAQGEREKGIELYKQGRQGEAIAVLERAGKQKEFKSDPEVFNYLGLAYAKNNDLKRARKTLEKTVKLSPQNADYLTNLAYVYLLAGKSNEAQRRSDEAIKLNPRKSDAYYVRGVASLREGKYEQALADGDKAIGIDADYALAYLLKSDALLSNFGARVGAGAKPADALDLLGQSKEILKTCLSRCRNNAQANIQIERLTAVSAFYDYFSRRKDASLIAPPAVALNAPPDPNALKITAKPRASYTDRARQAGVTGTIQLAVLFSESGRVTQALVLKGLGAGLDAEAIKAASGIEFEPAKENGKPISVVKVVEYSFTIY